MADVVNALQAELESLESELAADPRYQKIGKIRELLTMYGQVVQQGATEPNSAATAARASPRGRAGSLTSRVLDAATSYLRQTGRRAQTSELAAACVAAGVPLPDSLTKQRDYVSSILSHSPKIDNVRGQGYGLAEWSSKKSEENFVFTEPPDSEPTLSGNPMFNGVLPLSV